MRFRGREWNGDGVEVALIDSGVDTGDSRLSNAPITGWRVGVNATGHAQLAADFHDDHGHGTEVAAALLRDAPGVQITVIKVADAALKAAPEALAAGIETAFRHGARIINLSLAAVDEGRKQLLREACSMAREHGAWVVASAHPHGTAAFPGDFPEALSVLSHPDCPQGRIFYFEPEAFSEGPYKPFLGRFLTHGFTHETQPQYRGAGMATASLSARLACLLQALPEASQSELLVALRRQALCPDPDLGFA
jgi:subtilisin family serine protease